jgi:hypothetical protein
MDTGFELKRGRENSSFPVEEGSDPPKAENVGKPWVSEKFNPAGGTRIKISESLINRRVSNHPPFFYIKTA